MLAGHGEVLPLCCDDRSPRQSACGHVHTEAKAFIIECFWEVVIGSSDALISEILEKIFTANHRSAIDRETCFGQ